MIHQNPSCGVPQLKDVLQDPDASWSQIREAMKSSSGGCTNAAIVGALASRAGGGAVTISPDDDNIETKSVIKASTVNNNNTAAVAKDGVDTVSPLRAGSFSEAMTTNDAASVPSENNTQDKSDDITNSQNRRPARRSARRRNSGLRGSRTSSFRMSKQGSGRRGLLVGTHNSSFRSQMSDSSKKSEASSRNKEWAPAQLSFNASVKYVLCDYNGLMIAMYLLPIMSHLLY